MKKWLKRIVVWGSVAFTSMIVLAGGAGLVWMNIDSPPPPPVAAAPVVEEITASAIYNLVNAERVKAAVPALSNNPAATSAAESKCRDMVDQDYYDHINPNTGVHGYDYALNAIPQGRLFNENLTEGGVTSNAKVVQAWLDSPPHKATMLEPKYTDTGIAVCHRNSQPARSHIVVEEFVQILPAQQQTTQPARKTCVSTNTYSYADPMNPRPTGAITTC